VVSVVQVIFAFVPLLPFKEGLGVVLINLKDKNEVKSQKHHPPTPSLTTGGGAKTYFSWPAIA
jgi:hypothetical protein